MQPSPLLAPLVALVGWSCIMLLWMMVTRFPAMKKLGISLKGRVGGSSRTPLDGVVPDATQWKAHNYAHLMEQPTLFYAIVIALVLMGFDHQINVWLAWGYVALRIAHSIVQATSNVIAVRFALFFLSSLCLISLTIHAGLYLSHHHG